jgi:hypothetical protein
LKNKNCHFVGQCCPTCIICHFQPAFHRHC